MPLTMLVALGVSAAPGSDDVYVQDAVVINVTEHDLNRILREAFRANGGPRFEGHKRRMSKGVTELSYSADLSEPVLTLGDDGDARLDLDIVRADLRIGRFERRFLNRRAFCENAGVSVDPAEPVSITLALRFRIEERDLRILPETVSIPNPESFRLVKPSRCRRALLPKWLIWWIGRPHLKRRLDGLDDILLERAHESAADLNDGDGMLKEHWEIESLRDRDRTEDLYLYPRSLDTRGGALRVRLSSSRLQQDGPVSDSPVWMEAFSDRTFVGLSEAFLNSLSRSLFAGTSDGLHQPAGNLGRLLESGSVYTLIPGLRELESTDDLRFSFSFGSAPRIEIATAPEEFANLGQEAAMIRIHLAGTRLRVRKDDGRSSTPLGELRIEHGTLGVVPYPNVLGGVSFEVVENEWSLSSRGVDFNESLLAATLQELAFGEVFETRYRPLWRDALKVGEAEFVPRRFSAAGGYLVIELAEPVPELRASSSQANR